MKKFFLLLVGCLFSILPTLGQATVIATLNQNNTVTAYYGVNALKEAYDAAQDGAIITLSPGQFNATDIDKNIIIRGSGMNADGEKNRQPTVLTGDFTLKNSGEVKREITLEGIYHNGSVKYDAKIESAQFTKCRFNIFENNEEGTGIFTFINCRIANKIKINGSESSAYVINSIIINPLSTNEGNFSYENEKEICFCTAGAKINPMLY